MTVLIRNLVGAGRAAPHQKAGDAVTLAGLQGLVGDAATATHRLPGTVSPAVQAPACRPVLPCLECIIGHHWEHSFTTLSKGAWTQHYRDE